MMSGSSSSLVPGQEHATCLGQSKHTDLSAPAFPCRKYLAGVNEQEAFVFADFRSVLDEVHAKLRRDTSLQLG